ncbi:molybdopterin biosynthesis protein MoeB [Corynebacterium lizhenjunii]|uniref:Molybdopterin biosynthesis protein MoeB n=1 Tax=Corynebacterium lizhenjunii TaxID=2709394 RepID=A0A7T0KFT3_9CORY|nr:molybdopterin-binding protein [Corynebacterium lizhenjunii]QPK79986.1 molybdopterin biosynthesis protein MoeB [Corynebacterium lizhenjunii]
MTAHSAAVIICSDRILAKQKPDTVSSIAAEALHAAGCRVAPAQLVAEDYAQIDAALSGALAAGHRVIMLIGGTGVRAGNWTPEVTQKYVQLRLHGLETQVLLAGLEHSAKAGLSRGIIGMTSHEGTLIITSASSAGAVRDVLGVVTPLLPSLLGHCEH